MHRDVFCQFPFRWIYYYGSNKSTGKEAGKVHRYGHKILQYLHLTFDCMYCTEVLFASFFSGGFITAIVVNPLERKLAKCTSVYCSQKLGEDFAKFCGLLRIYELYQNLPQSLNCLLSNRFQVIVMYWLWSIIWVWKHPFLSVRMYRELDDFSIMFFDGIF